MKNNNFKGLISLGLQIVISLVLVSIGVYTLISSTAQLEGEPAGKEPVKLEEKKEDLEGSESSEKAKQENILDTGKDEISKDNKEEAKKLIKDESESHRKDSPSPSKKEEEATIGLKKEMAEEDISFKEEVVEESINFKTIEEKDSKLEKGKKEVKQKGQKGLRTIVYKVEYANGRERQRNEISNKITKKPLDEIIRVGTKEKPKSSGRDLPNNYGYSYKGDLESRMIKLVNDFRKENKLEPLKVSGDMGSSARYKSLSMLQLNYFNHNNPNFPDQSLNHLMRNVFGYKNYVGFGENIGYTSSGSKAIDDLFLTFSMSPGHKKNMLDPGFKYIGVGVVQSKSSGSTFPNQAIIITQHFGK